MFRCHFCGQVTPPNTKRHNIVVATRQRDYPTRRRETKGPRGRFRAREEPVQDRGGKGLETAKEVPACPTCAAKQHEVETVVVAPPVEEIATESDALVGDAEASSDAEAPATEAPATDATATDATVVVPESPEPDATAAPEESKD